MGIAAFAAQGGAGLRWRPQSVKRFEAPTEPAGETAIPFGILSQQGALAPIGDVRAKGTAVPLES